jgi:hypothetical protein
MKRHHLKMQIEETKKMKMTTKMTTSKTFMMKITSKKIKTQLSKSTKMLKKESQVLILKVKKKTKTTSMKKKC